MLQKANTIEAISVILFILISATLFPYTYGETINIISVGRDSVVWIYVANKSITTSLFKELQVYVAPYKGLAYISSNLNLSEELTFNSNISFYMFGGSSIYYSIATIAPIIFNRSIVMQREVVEGIANIDLDGARIVVEWHRYQLTLTSKQRLAYNTSIVRSFLTDELKSSIEKLGKDYISNIDGFEVIIFNPYSISVEYPLYNIYINTTKYLKQISPGISIQTIIKNIPIRCDVDLMVGFKNRTGLWIVLSITGVGVEDPITSYLWMNTLIPFLLDLYTIITNATGVTLLKQSSIYIVLQTLLPQLSVTLLNNFVSNLYKEIANLMLVNNLSNTMFIMVVRSDRIYMSFNSSNLYRAISYSESDTKTFVKRLYSIVVKSFPLVFSTSLDSYIDNAYVELYNKTATAPQTPSQLNNTMLIKILWIVIGIVAIQTSVVIYMMYRLLAYRKKR